MSLRSRGTALLLAITAGACADAVTSAPDPAAPDEALRTAGDDADEMLIASRFLDARQYGWTTVGILPDSAWVVIDVTGTVDHSANSDCETLPPAWAWTWFPWDGLSAGPLFGASQVSVAAESAGTYRLRSVNGDPATSTHARTLVFSHRAGIKVQARRLSYNGLCGNPTAGEWYPAYNLTGGQQITLTRIATPLVIDAPHVVAPNQKARFTVTPYGSLELE